ncbi:DUF2254 domain-containing protein [Pseudonocardia petroleophila]|uniref:DUF2254 domain-containing protein n=1 Tax=Pseudonocardia petroleophila TaxID=37331 RepID=A0A7G7MFD3_9PSEU|nr:DUF2254 domain-containing protein [Pseudonocardia petroleophila]
MRDSFWLLPGLLCLLAAVLAEALIALDQQVDELDLGPFAVLATRIGESGSRDVLGAIAGSVLGVAATSFSITIAVLATASSTYGPRLVRNFMTDRGNQFVLGVYAATFVYCLLTLRSIREPGGADEVFVPHLAVNVAVLLAVLSIGVLIWFINHIADSVQVGTLSRRVRAELVDTVDRLYPEQLGRAPSEVPRGAGAHDVPSGLRSEGVEVRADTIGYVQGVAEDRLLDLATRHDVVISLRVRPGSHVVEGDVVALVWPPDRVDDRLGPAVRSGLTVGRARTPDQDVDYAVLVLEEMAVRALSPSTNDPYTAVNALDDLAAGLTHMVGRDVPSPYRYGPDDRLRVIAPRTGPVELVDRVFDAIRWHGTGHPPVLHRMCGLAEQLAGAARDPELRDRLVAHLERLQEAFERTAPQRCDAAELRRRAAQSVAAVRASADPTGARPS